MPPRLAPRVLPFLVCVALLVAGCASGDDTTQPAGSSSSSTPSSDSPSAESPSPSASESARIKGQEIVVSVKDGKVTPKPGRVKVTKDTQVRLLVTSDVDDELHVHGFDLEKEMPAGQTVTLKFTADQQGVFEIETHESELVLLQLEVR